MSEIDAAVIKRTQETLGKYVKKPALSEKLLKKPPFRFLHDVFNAVIRETGYFQGLYSPDELNHETITDRDGKMKFLQKMIDAIKIITNQPLTVRTSKIVAGHEPEKTNELLQFIGIVIEKKLDWKTAVEKVNNEPSPSSSKQKIKEKPPKEKKPVTDKSPTLVTKKSESSKEKMKTDSKEKVKLKDSKEKSSRKLSKAIDNEKKDERKTKSKPLSKESTRNSSSKKSPVLTPVKIDPKLESQVEAKTNPDNLIVSENKDDSLTKRSENLEEEIPVNKTGHDPISSETRSPAKATFKQDENPAIKRAEEILPDPTTSEDNAGNESRRSSGSKRSSGRSRRSSAEKTRKGRAEITTTQTPSEPNDPLKTVAEEQATEVAINSSEKSQSSPVSSISNSDVKRESTFVREDSKESAQIPARPRTSLRPPSARPASARPGAPRRRDKNIEIVLQPNDQIKMSGISVKLETFNSELEDDGENLVIIENPNTDDQLQGNISKENNSPEDDSLQQGHLVQQILETQKELVQSSSPDTEQKREKENDISKLNSRQSSARQMNSLRDVIQNLTKSVNPLGKLMDFIPEDIDAMQLELSMWRDTYNQSSIELKKERSLTESVTEPMKNQLISIEANIKEYREMIDSCRAKILQNAEKIQRLLTTQ